MQSFKDLDEDELNELLDKSEQENDFVTSSSILLFSLSDDNNDEALSEAACDGM
jgi:hypothetical protein